MIAKSVMPLSGNRLLQASQRHCHRETRIHARSFYFSSFALPREKKAAAFAIYAFCRYADDLVDHAAHSGDSLDAALAKLDFEFDELMASNGAGFPFGPAFVHAVKRFGIPKRHFLDLVKGVRMDLGPVRIPDWPALRHYCYHVASVVGLMMSRIFELRDSSGEERAIDLGIAMQLTNIIRDVGEDMRNDRIYLPATELAEYEVTEQDLRWQSVSDNFRELMKFQIARARRYYESAEVGIPLLADDGSQYTVWLMREVYAGILDEVEKINYDVLHHRAATTLSRKFVLAGRAWSKHKRASASASAA